MDKVVEIYTDGACSGNPGPGGWAAVLLYRDKVKEISGAERSTTNQRMELKAVISALKALKVRGWRVRVYTDSAYIANAFSEGWLDRWVENGWKTKDNKPVTNQDLWKELVVLCRQNEVEVVKVRGHDGVKWNERCDHLARTALERMLAEEEG